MSTIDPQRQEQQFVEWWGVMNRNGTVRHGMLNAEGDTALCGAPAIYYRGVMVQEHKTLGARPCAKCKRIAAKKELPDG